MAAFATSSDLATYIQRDLSAEDTATAELILDLVSAEMRAYTGQTISFVADDEAILDLPRGRIIDSLEWPVTAVTSVTVGDTALVADTDYYWYRMTGLIELVSPWRWWNSRDLITVVYSHGWATGTPQIGLAQSICLAVAKRVMATSGGIDVKSESIGNYSYTAADAHGSLYAVDDEAEGWRVSLSTLRPLVLA